MGSFSSPNPPTLKKSSSSQSNKSQKSIVGFFKPKINEASQPAIQSSTNPNSSKIPVREGKGRAARHVASSSSQSLTPAPSSDAIDATNSDEESVVKGRPPWVQQGLPSPITPLSGVTQAPPVSDDSKMAPAFSSPSRKV